MFYWIFIYFSEKKLSFEILATLKVNVRTCEKSVEAVFRWPMVDETVEGAVSRQS